MEFAYCFPFMWPAKSKANYFFSCGENSLRKGLCNASLKNASFQHANHDAHLKEWELINKYCAKESLRTVR